MKGKDEEQVRMVRAMPGRAPALVERLEKDWHNLSEGNETDRQLVLLVSCNFGIRRVLKITALGRDTAMLLVAAENGDPSESEVLYLPIEDCSFLFRCLSPTEESERIVVGFGQASVADSPARPSCENTRQPALAAKSKRAGRRDGIRSQSADCARVQALPICRLLILSHRTLIHFI